MARRLFAGRIGGSWRFRISKPGYDAKTEADGSANIAFDSNFASTLPLFYRTQIVTPSSAVNQFNINFPSTLPYIPLCTVIQNVNNWGDTSTRNGLKVPDSYLWATRDFVRYYVVAYAVFADRVRVDGLTSEFTGVTQNFPLNTYLGDLLVFAVPSGA